MTSFNDFGLAEPILRALAQENYQTPTPIQAQTISPALTGRDVVGIAQTGTGKTAAFALPILHQLAAKPGRPERKTCRVLVLSPTRELSAQILDSFNAYGRHLGVSTTLAIGGVPMGRQVRALLNGVDVLVATPGRLLDLVRSNALRLGRVEILVLDEADRMLDMGFIHDIRKIVAHLPKARQTLFFSATMPQQIAELAGEMLRDPVRVAVTPAATTAERVEQRVVHVGRAAKPGMLADLLRGEPIDRALVFTRTKHGADKVVRGLVKAGIAAHAIHGNKSQSQRERVLGDFRAGKIRTLVATDIAARGIDVDGISHVVNYDLPNEPESYVHRIGRTARAGATGIAISLVDPEEAPYLRAIERLIRLSIPAQGNPPAEHAQERGTPRERNGARGHRRGRTDRHAGGGHPQGEPRRGHRHGGGQGRGDQARGDQARGDQARGDQARGDQARGAQGRGEQAHADQGRGNQARGDHGRGDQGRGEQARGDRARGGHGRGDQNGSSHRGHRGSRSGGHAAPVYGEHARAPAHAPSQANGHPAPREAQQSSADAIGTVGFMRRPVPARREDAGRPPR